jgi:NADH-quinone oxidoreductase subunit F
LGTQRQVEIIDRMADGGLQKGDLAALQDIGFAMTNASLCGLGMTAATAILSALERWPELGD